MAEVFAYSEVKINESNGYCSTEAQSIKKYNSFYDRAYSIYEELINGEFFADDVDLLDDLLEELINFVSTLKDDYKIHERDSRATRFSNHHLKHYRTHFNNLLIGLREERAKLLAPEINRN